MKALTKILGFAVAALIVVALGFYFIEVYAPSPANPTQPNPTQPYLPRFNKKIRSPSAA
jgi:hypothetical protein